MSDTARDKAIAAMNAELYYPPERGKAHLAGRMIDAVPDQVLADLLIERGALTEQCRCGHSESVHGVENEEWTPGCEECRNQGRGHPANHPYDALYRLTPKHSVQAKDPDRG
jgi:hypothetical protein